MRSLQCSSASSNTSPPWTASATSAARRPPATCRSRRCRRRSTNSISTLIAHARTGLPGITAHTWLFGHALPAGLRAIPLVDPVIEHTIGLVTATDHQRAPVIGELVAMFAPLELDARVRPEHVRA